MSRSPLHYAASGERTPLLLLHHIGRDRSICCFGFRTRLQSSAIHVGSSCADRVLAARERILSYANSPWGACVVGCPQALLHGDRGTIMSATTPEVRGQRPEHPYEDRSVRRLSETKASFKTTEFISYLAVMAGIFIAGAVTKSGSDGTDVFRAHQVWLYAAIVTVGYMVSRGLAKSGSRGADAGER
jgi:hypothetical protein